MRKRLLLFAAVALLMASNAYARERALPAAPKDNTFIVLLYCTPWAGCFMAMFVYEEVEVVASTGRLDVDWNGSWGSREGCPHCELEHPAPAPEPVEGGGENNGCGDARDDIIAEYSARVPNGIPTVPGCADFSSSGSTEHFTWGEMNHSEDNDHQPWGIVTAPLWGGLENTRYDWEDSYGYGAIKVNSGYRCPHINQTTSTLAPYTSRHMYGEAADFKPLASDSRNPAWNQDTWGLLKDAAVRNDAVNPESWAASQGTHLHVEWR